MDNMLYLQKAPQETQAGFTLVEALIAMLILVVAIVGWMGAQDASVSNRGLSRTMTVATELVQSKIEELSEDPASYCSSPPCNNQEEKYTVGGFEYTLEWEMERDKLSDGNGTLPHARPLWIIEVTGKWNFQGEKSIASRRVVNE